MMELILWLECIKNKPLPFGDERQWHKGYRKCAEEALNLIKKGGYC